MNALARSLRSARVLVALMLILCIGACAVFAPLLAPHDPADQDLRLVGEARAIEQIRKLGNGILTQWAEKSEQTAVAKARANNAELRPYRKKNC